MDKKATLTLHDGRKVEFPAVGVEYWSDARCKQPLVPADTDDEKTLEIAKLLKLRLFKTISVPLDVNLTTPPPQELAPAADPPSKHAGDQARVARSILSFLRRKK